MKSFDLAEPATIEEAVALLDPQDKSVRAIAGGTALMLMMLGAKVSAVSPRGRRWVDVCDLFTGYYQTSLIKDELITAVEIAGQPPGVYCCYEKFTARSADDWPTVGVAVRYTVASGVIGDARVAVSAATERPMRSAAAEAALTNALLAPDVFSKAAEAAADGLEPIADLHGSASYKREMVRVHIRRALEKA